MLFLPQTDKQSRVMTLPETALLVNLYYRNSENAAAAAKVMLSRDTTKWTDIRAPTRNSYSTATRPTTRNQIHARWSFATHRELRPTIVKLSICRRTCDQLIFPNSLASTITRSHSLRFLVMGLFERKRLPGAFDNCVGFEKQYSQPYKQDLC
ncbi:hypothetical protein TNCV_3511611 [Trichonephila clavipes]|nr:hypothetical protein TNCV_3511611 [Trichonephila clavipes]